MGECYMWCYTGFISPHVISVLQSLIPDITASVLKSESLLDLNMDAAVSDDVDHKCDWTQEDSKDDDDGEDVTPLKRSISQVRLVSTWQGSLQSKS